MSGKKLAFVVNSLNGGGAETLTIKMSKAFGDAPVVILEDIVDYDTAELSVVKLSEGIPSRSLSRYLQLPGLARKLATVAGRDHLLVVSLFRAYLVAWIAKSFFGGGDFICWVHNDTTHYTRNVVVAWLYRRIFASATAVVVNSAKAKNDLEANGLTDGGKVHVIYNFFDPESIRAKASASLSDDVALLPTPFFVVMGRLHPTKEHAFLLNIFSSLPADSPDLVLIGSGDEEGSLREMVKLKSLEGRVHFMGFQSNPYPIIKRAEALISCSSTEGFGNVLVEAMICGVPVISTDIDSGPREILDPAGLDLAKRTKVPEMAKYGILMPHKNQGDPEPVRVMWRETLMDVMSDKSILEGYRELSDESFASFTQDHILKQWRNLFRRHAITNS